MSREQLVAEVKTLRDAIRTHRDSNGHDLCWHHPALWSLLPQKTDPSPPSPTGGSPCRDASGVANPSTSSFRARSGRTRPTARFMLIVWFID